MKHILPMLALVLAVSSVIIVTAGSDDSSAAICDDVKVYILNEDDSYTMSTVNDVQTVRDAINKAMADQGKKLELNLTMTNILSVDDRKPGDSQYWRVFQWLPAGTSGWGVQAFNQASNDRMMSGTTYCVTLSTITNVNGTNVYSEPNFKPVSTGYVFIRFANGFSPDNEHVKAVFTPEIRSQGFWLKAEGSTMGEVLKNAINANWPGEIETFTGNDGMGNDVADWINRMFGLGNDNLGDNVWAYWNQFCWVDHQWSYNSWTLGYYDPAVYPYIECIYLLSTPDPYGDGYVVDKGGPEPNPDTDTIVPMKNILTVDFKLPDGTVWKTQEVKYGQQANLSEIPEPTADGKGFVGWGDTTSVITTDTVFTAVFVDITPEMKCVTYQTEAGQFIRKEYVSPGSPATYDGKPVKLSTQQYDYEFSSWSSDLSSVTEDVTVKPVFTPKIRSYDVNFYNYDRSFISASPTEYGSSAVTPAPPTRDSTVRYQYTFKGWSITPNNYVPVDLSNITDITYAYAYFEPEAREYTLTFMENGSTVGTYPAKYGSSIGGTYPMDVFKGNALVKMYRDPALSKEYDTNYIVVGDTTVYVSRIVGSYDAPRDGDGNMSGDTVTVSFTPALAASVTKTDSKIVVCDLSQYPNGTEVLIGKESVQNLISANGGDATALFIVPRGSFSMPLSSVLTVMGDGDELTFSVQNGPFNVKISSALKKINYSAFYRLDLRVDGMSVMDLKSLGVKADVTVLLELDSGVHADVWNITSSGATTHIEPSYDGRFAGFTTDLMQFYAVGTTEDKIVRQVVVCPYGIVEYTSSGSGLKGSVSLESMTLDNMGSILFVPSSFGGITLQRMEAGALNGVVNAPSAVIPVTVEFFSWLNWTNTGIKDVYFLGNSPVFEGSAPAGVNVHHRPDATGWSTGSEDLVVYKYEGAYRKDTFTFTYYIVGDSAVVHRFVTGPYVQIPDSVSVAGTSYPIAYIGDAAFMKVLDSSLIERYQLEFQVGLAHELQTLELNSHVKGILTSAFYGSTIANLYVTDSVTHISDLAFMNCSNLSNVTFSDELVFIGYGAFAACDGKAFTRFTVPDSVREIGASAFYGCSNLSTIILGKGLISIPADCFGYCARLTDLDIPAGVVSLGEKAFYNCTGLQYVDLNQVESVGKDAFYMSSGTSSMEFVVFGENMKDLGDAAFGNCKNITEIEVHCEYFSSFENAFINVDVDSLSIYASDNVLSSWSGYNVQPITEPEPQKDQTLLMAVELGLIIMFVGIFAVSLYRKMRSGI